MTNPQIPVPPPPTAADEYAVAGQAAGETPEQTAARLAAYAQVNAAQTPEQYMAAAIKAGLATTAFQAAAGQVQAGVPAGPVPAPSFEQQLAEYQQRNAALEQQIAGLNASFAQQLAQLQAGLAAVQASVPQKVDPVTESAAKVVQAFRDVIAHDAKNILGSALNSHLVNLGLGDLAKLL